MLRDWIISVLCAGFIVSAVKALAGEGEHRALDLCCGLLCAFALLFPFVSGRTAGRGLRLEDRRREAESAVSEKTEREKTVFADIIEARCAEYIIERAGELGISCKAEVTCEEREGVPVPVRAAVIAACPENGEVTGLIERELNIPKEEQEWIESHESG